MSKMSTSRAQDAEAELQQSVMLSQQGFDNQSLDGENDSSIQDQSQNDGSIGASRKTAGQSAESDELTDRDASGDEDMDAEGEEDLTPYETTTSSHNNTHANLVEVGSNMEIDGEAGDEDAEGEDAEGEDVEQDDGLSGDEDLEEDAEGEMVSDGENSDDDVRAAGARQSKPRHAGSTASQDESDVLSQASGDEEESDGDDWDEAGEAEDDDDEAEAGQDNICLFCRQDEENDPSEDFEAFLTCESCKQHAHQQCAREAAALTNDNRDRRWRCPTCFGSQTELDDDDADVSMDDQDEVAAEGSNENAQTVDEDDILYEDTRPQRKRKSASPEADDDSVSVRKRRRPPMSSTTGSITDGDLDSGRRSDSRPLRLKVARPARVAIEKQTRSSLVLSMRVRPSSLKEICRTSIDTRNTINRAARTPRPSAPSTDLGVTPAPILETPFTADSYSQPFYSFFDKETDDAKGKPYGGILTDKEADTSKTLPKAEDRRKFDDAKKRAEDEWRARVLAKQAEAEMPVKKHKKSVDHASQIECINFGGWEIDTWYAAPYPAEYSRNRVLYICEFCLKYMNSDYVAWRHKLKCGTKHPPGDEIYRHGSISFFEVDGRKNPVYCQNLCLLAKLFLGSKTLYYDVEPFLFYVLCEYDKNGYHFVGYFSKEKRSSSQNNVSCILTLPIHQRKGYGNLLIDFSYLLTKVEEKTGSPEKPLSDMGLVSYRNYWRLILCQYLIRLMSEPDFKRKGLSIRQISDDTGMTPDDIISALEGLRALVRDPVTRNYAFRVDLEYCKQYVAKWEAKKYVQLESTALAWTPYVMGRSSAVNFELGPPINTIAPREDDEAKLEEGPDALVEGSKPVANGLDKAGNTLTNGGETSNPPNGVVADASGENKENALPGTSDLPAEVDKAAQDPDAWSLPYRNIPPARFEVYPAVTHGRQYRPVVARAPSSASRPKRPSSSIRRPTVGRPKTSSSGSSRKKATGGTGRGPGRWPKGTKKSDYGNAASGPGLPPGWSASDAAAEAAAEVGAGKAAAVQTPNAPLESTMGASDAVGNGDEDADGVEDVDAEGETE